MTNDVDGLGLGRLERVENLRDVWAHEATHFTPWLAANIEVLSDAIGVPLTVVEQEVDVGDFRLDIHAIDPDGKTVIIENQLEPSDHIHLGQLLVYTSGLEASTAVWIAPRLRDEHRSALTWLNERTDSDVRAFGIELGLVRIGGSVLAPVLDVVVEPNDWTKVTKQVSAAPASARNQARMEFFGDVFDLLASTYSVIRAPRGQATSWCSFASGPFGYYSLSFSKQGYRVEIYLDAGEQGATKALFDQLAGRRDDYYDKLGFELVWDRLNSNRGSRIAAYLDAFTLEASTDEERKQAVQWSVGRVEALHRTFDADLRGIAGQVKSSVESSSSSASSLD